LGGNRVAVVNGLGRQTFMQAPINTGYSLLQLDPEVNQKLAKKHQAVFKLKTTGRHRLAKR
jgi:hypothetical protein